MDKKPMDKIEKALYKEHVIKEYKRKHEKRIKFQIWNDLLSKIKKLVTANIAIGLVAAALLGYFWDLKTLAYVFLFSIIWATLISTLISLFIKPQ
jgi:L-rhamnose mutarotase